MRPHLRLIALVGLIVPSRLRADWRQEWEAELRCRELMLADWDRLDRHNRLDLLRRSTSAFWDAIWLQPRRLEDEVFQDVRHGLRMLVTHKGFTVVAVLSLALGIGATTAIFSVVDALMLKPLPVRQPEQLVTLAANYPGEGGARPTFVYQTFENFRDRTQVFSNLSAVCAINRFDVTIDAARGGVRAGRVRAGLVSGNYFSMLGVDATVGRTLTADDDGAPGGHPVVVLSHAFWKRELALAADVVGRMLTLNGTTYTIVGVARAGFTGEWVGQPTDIWFPIAMQPQVVPEQPDMLTAPNAPTWVRILARLKPGVSVTQAQPFAQSILDQWLDDTFSPAARQGMGRVQLTLEPAARGFSLERKSLARPVLIMLVVVGLVLLIACANVANLLLARATARRQEIATRVALGGSPSRIVRQLLTESGLLAVLGAALGLVLAQWGARALAQMVGSGNQPLALDVSVDGRLLVFTSALCLLTGLVFGLAPAWHTARISLAPALRGRGAGTARPARRVRLVKVLVIAQVALSLVLLVGAGLFIRTLRNLRAQDFGFDREHVLLVRASLNQPGRQDAALATLYQTVQERLSSLPGVRAASPSHGGVSPSGFMNGVSFDSAIRFVGDQTIVPGAERRALWYVVAPGFFDAMGIRLTAGRDFTTHDTAATPRVAVINHAMARHYFGDRNPIGMRFGFNRNLTFEVTGVVKAEKYNSPRDEDRLLVFLPYRQDPNARSVRDEMLLAVRTQGRPTDLAIRIRQELRQIDASLPVVSITTMEDELGRALVPERLVAMLAGGFGVLALLLACIGLYGVTSYDVARRTQEIGVRMALGASTQHVVRLVLRDTLALVLLGAALGSGAALATTRFVSSVLYGLQPNDPLTLALSVLLLLAVAALAAYLPAHGATRVDPLLALRHE